MEITVTDSNFEEEVLKSPLPVMVDFWAVWCGPCRMIAPAVKELAEKYEGKLKVAKVNVDECPNLSSNYRIMSIPTLNFFKNGSLAGTLIGAHPKEKIEEEIKKII